MGFFDLAAPLLGAVNQVLSLVLPAVVCLVLWGVLAGWLTMVVYRKLSNQNRIQQLKAEQKNQQKIISNFDGEFKELLPVIRHTLGLGMRQLGLSLGPALLATIPVLFIVVWVAGEFGYQQAETGTPISIETTPAHGNSLREEQARLDGNAQHERYTMLKWNTTAVAQQTETGWLLEWPSIDQPVSLMQEGKPLFSLPSAHSIPVIHKHQWWNWLIANPIGYLPDDAVVEAINIGLPEQQFIGFGPHWLRGWMFGFFASFMLSTVGFKLALKID